MQSLMVRNRDLERSNAKLNYLLSCANLDIHKLRSELVRLQGASMGAVVASESAELTARECRPKYAARLSNSLLSEYRLAPRFHPDQCQEPCFQFPDQTSTSSCIRPCSSQHQNITQLLP